MRWINGKKTVKQMYKNFGFFNIWVNFVFFNLRMIYFHDIELQCYAYKPAKQINDRGCQWFELKSYAYKPTKQINGRGCQWGKLFSI